MLPMVKSFVRKVSRVLNAEVERAVVMEGLEAVDGKVTTGFELQHDMVGRSRGGEVEEARRGEVRWEAEARGKMRGIHQRGWVIKDGSPLANIIASEARNSARPKEKRWGTTPHRAWAMAGEMVPQGQN